ncbi:MAG: hypothetical protein ACTSPB_13310, partial [Candidatus Thorarchaeota archaeon]
ETTTTTIIDTTTTIEGANCYDNTSSDECSADHIPWTWNTGKPFYCDNGELIPRCDLCGCRTGTEEYPRMCMTNGSCGIWYNECISGTLIENITPHPINLTGGVPVTIDVTFIDSGARVYNENMTETELVWRGMSEFRNYITGARSGTHYPTNARLDFGADGDYEWRYPGELNHTVPFNMTSENGYIDEFMEHINNCPETRDGRCIIPITFESDTDGVLYFQYNLFNCNQSFLSAN